MGNRGREYRRFQQSRVYKKRLKNMSSGFAYFLNSLNKRIYSPEWFDLLGNGSIGNFYVYKNVSTTNWDSKYRDKWSSLFYGNNKHKSRTFQKKETKRLINEIY
jgi:hypothetical protein